MFFVGKWHPGISVDSGTMRPALEALAVNFALFGLWSLQHIGMARPAFKAHLTRWLPAAIERSTYVLATGLATGALIFFWSPLPTTLWLVEHDVAAIVIRTISAAGWVFALCGILYDSYPEFMGIRQVRRFIAGRPFRPAAIERGIGSRS